jgi:kumamolisin
MMAPEPNLVPLNDSKRDPLPGAEDIGPADGSQTATVTVVLKPKEGSAPADVLSADVRSHQYLTRSELGAQRGADPAAVERVRQFAARNSLAAVEKPEQRLVDLTGTVEDLSRAFDVQLRTFRTPEVTYRGRVGVVRVPADIADDVVAVLGLDDRPQVRPDVRVASSAGEFAGYPPAEIGKFYGFPATVTGAGQCIGIAEFGGGFEQADLDAYFSAQGLPAIQVEAVGVAGGSNQPGVDSKADGEVMLDIEVAHSLAPDAKIVVYFAPTRTNGFASAVKAAIHDSANNPSVLSISWGGPEDSWTPQMINTLESALADAAQVGLTVLASSGDDGSRNNVNDGHVHVNYPASSPQVLGCGGTRITVDNGAITDEVVWNDGVDGGSTGGGVSALFPVPSYQASANIPVNADTGQSGRGVPDVSADASLASGYMIELNGGQVRSIGGTSAATPLWAGLVALANQHVGKPVGFLNAALYQNSTHFNDITSGDNNITGTLSGYQARTGWDACTGLGTPQGATLIGAL